MVFTCRFSWWYKSVENGGQHGPSVGRHGGKSVQAWYESSLCFTLLISKHFLMLLNSCLRFVLKFWSSGFMFILYRYVLIVNSIIKLFSVYRSVIYWFSTNKRKENVKLEKCFYEENTKRLFSFRRISTSRNGLTNNHIDCKNWNLIGPVLYLSCRTDGVGVAPSSTQSSAFFLFW